MLKKLSELLPVSRRKFLEIIQNTNIVLEGLVEAEANHCQIETNLVQQLQLIKSQETNVQKPKAKKNGSDPAFA